MDGSKILNNILEYSELNGKAFSEKIGLKRPQAIYDILNGKTQNISAAMANKIISVFPEINKGWLQSGEGPMLKASAAPQVEPVPAGPAAAQPDMVSIPREVWEVIRNQAASLQEKDALLREKTEMLKETAESFGRRDRQIDELIALLREEIERGDDAGSLYRAASQAAAD